MASSKTLSEGYLAAMLADCPSFAALCTGHTVADCIYTRRLPTPDDNETDEDYRPYGLIECVDTETQSRTEAVGTTEYTMRHRVVIARTTPTADQDDADSDWEEICRDIEDELNDRKNTAGFLCFTQSKIASVARSHAADTPDVGDAQFCEIEIETESAI